MIEEWKPVVGFEGRYEVSSRGRVRSLRYRNKVSDRLRDEPLILKQALVGSKSQRKEGKAYWAVALNGKATKIHRLVLIAFRGSPPHGLVGGHLDGNSMNNSLDNLAWISLKENQEHRNIHETDNRGEKSFYAKLTNEDVLEIRAKRKQGATLVELAKVYGVGMQAISQISLRRTWKHVLETK